MSEWRIETMNSYSTYILKRKRSVGQSRKTEIDFLVSKIHGTPKPWKEAKTIAAFTLQINMTLLKKNT